MSEENTNNQEDNNTGGGIVDKVQNALRSLGGNQEVDDKQKDGFSQETPEVKEVPDFIKAIAGATPEQLQQFKQLLDKTPNKIATKPDYSEAHLLKEPVSGRYVVAFSDQYPSTKYDELLQKQVNCPMINIRLLDIETGKTEDIKEEYKKFMYEYIKVDVKLLQRFIDPKEASEGITESMETGETVEMVKTWVNETYRIELPEGKKITLPARVLNAGAVASKVDTKEDELGKMSDDEPKFDIV